MKFEKPQKSMDFLNSIKIPHNPQPIHFILLYLLKIIISKIIVLKLFFFYKININYYNLHYIKFRSFFLSFLKILLIVVEDNDYLTMWLTFYNVEI